MSDKAIVKILRSTPNWWTVKITGASDDSTIDELIASYTEILRTGIQRVCLNLTESNPEFTLVHRRTPDVLQVARRFQRVGALVSDAKTAFAIKAGTKVPEDEFRFFYDEAQLSGWLEA